MLDLVRFHCLRCHHTWVPRNNAIPKRCPRCFTALWNKEYARAERVTDRVMTRIHGCPLRLCQQRYDRLVELRTVNVESIDNKPTQAQLDAPFQPRRMLKITKDNFPDAFKRIKHGGD